MVVHAPYPENQAIKCFHKNAGKMYTKPDLHPDNLFRPDLLAGSLEFDVQLGAQDCGCVAKFGAMAMPAKNIDG